MQKDCYTCDRVKVDDSCPLPKKDTETCLQNSSRPFWQAEKTDKEKLDEFILNGKTNQPKSHNNGGSTDYYKFQPDWTDCQDIIESRGMNFSQGNIFKVAFCFNQGRHSSSTYERELNKIIWFAQRELDRGQKELSEKEPA